MILRTLETMGTLHGYGIARRIEQTSGNQLSVNYGTIYPALLNWGRMDTFQPEQSLKTRQSCYHSRHCDGSKPGFFARLGAGTAPRPHQRTIAQASRDAAVHRRQS